jgi:hypothetical protein
MHGHSQDVFQKGHPIFQERGTNKKIASDLKIRRLMFIFMIALEYSR